jgi:hypothetical protein
MKLNRRTYKFEPTKQMMYSFTYSRVSVLDTLGNNYLAEITTFTVLFTVLVFTELDPIRFHVFRENYLQRQYFQVFTSANGQKL